MECNSVLHGDLHLSTCPRCGGLLILEYKEPVFTVSESEVGIWRYSSLLPDFSRKLFLGEGLTPIRRLGGSENVFIKDEGRNPTGSYADRASAIITSYLSNLDTPGGMVTVRYVEDFTKSLVEYIGYFNSTESILVHAPDISSIGVEDLIYIASKNVGITRDPRSLKGVYVDYANPLTVEGLKTIAFEIYESRVKAENIVVPAETGLLAFSIRKGLEELRRSGVEVDYRVVAVHVESRETPYLLKLLNVEIVKISDEEAYEALKTLISRGFKVKPIAAISFYVSENLGNSIAILSGGFKRALRSRQESMVKKTIIEVLRRKGSTTAYGIWREKPVYTLRGFYKALKSMEKNREICYEITSKGKRKVKLYKLC